MAVSDDYMRSLNRKGVDGLTGQALENFIKNWNSGAFSREQMDELAPIASGVGAGSGYDYDAADAAWADYQQGVAEGRYASGLSKGSVIARSQGDWSQGLNIKEIMNPDLVFGNPPSGVINNNTGGTSSGGYGQVPAPEPTAPRPGDYTPSVPAPLPPTSTAPPTNGMGPDGGQLPPSDPFQPPSTPPQMSQPPIAPPQGGAPSNGDPFQPGSGQKFIDSFLPGSRNDQMYTNQFNQLANQNQLFQNQQAQANAMRGQPSAPGVWPEDPFSWLDGGLPDRSDPNTPAPGGTAPEGSIGSPTAPTIPGGYPIYGGIPYLPGYTGGGGTTPGAQLK